MLVDDHEIVRAGFRRLLDSADDITVIAEAASGEEAYRQYSDCCPDLVVMDLSMPPGAGGLEAIQRIRAVHPQAKILVLTVQECEPYPSRVMEAGARGYLTKRCAPEELLRAVRKVNAGDLYIADQIQQQLSSDNHTKLNQLTKRELQIFTLLADGQSAGQIAETMFISQKTVHAHRANIMHKLDLSKTTELIHLAIRHGIINV
jgi:two-component system invasion response regulator UvrY